MIRDELKQKIGQMIVAGFPSPEVDDQVRRLVEEYWVGNFALFARNYKTLEQVIRMNTELSEYVYQKTGAAPMICTDQEGGAVTRYNLGTALFPGTMAMAATHRDRVYDIGKHCGTVLRASGIICPWGPVLDVNLDPMNPIIGSRAYGDDPQVCGELGTAMMRGIQDAGAIATLKHFPGHGNVNSDSHLSVPRNASSREFLEQVDFAPFRMAFDNGAEALMTCHVVFEQIDDVPATLSHKIMTELLRDEMHFEGLAITDCMEMDAIRAAYGIGRGAVMAILAGCDILCFSHTFEAVSEAAEAIYKAIEDGTITEERIDASYRRIQEMKRRHGLIGPQKPDLEQARALLYDEAIISEHHSIAKESITLVRDDGGLKALREAKAPRFFAPPSIALTNAEDVEKKPNYFSDLMQARFGGTSVVFPIAELDEQTAAAIRDDSYDVAVVGLYNARFREGQRKVLRALEAEGRPLIVVMLGAPYDVACIERADAIIATYEYTQISAAAAVEAIAEGVYQGRLPVRVEK